MGKRGRPPKSSNGDDVEDSSDEVLMGEGDDEGTQQEEGAIPKIEEPDEKPVPAAARGKVGIFLCKEGHRSQGKVSFFYYQPCFYCNQKAILEGYYDDPKKGQMIRV